MNTIIKKIFIALIFTSSVSLTQARYAQANDFASGVFTFQQKLANSGNAVAQYQLGTMYESGRGIKKDTDKASYWFQRSAAQGNAQAKKQLVYVEIKKRGFIPSKHGDWLEALKKDAEIFSMQPEAMMLMAKMLRHGVAVKKDLGKSIELYEAASSLGFTEVESEIDKIRLQIEQEKEPVKEPQKAKPKKPKVTKGKNAGDKKHLAKQKKRRLKEEKRKRYEAAKRQLEEEQRLLEDQQRWSEQ